MPNDVNDGFDVHEMVEMLIKAKVFPQLEGKTLTECIAISVKESQTANTAIAHQWRVLLNALLTGALVREIKATTKP